MLKFFGLFGKAKATEGLKALGELVVGLDPDTAGQAEIEMYIGNLTKLSEQLAKARSEYDREVKEYEAAQNSYNKYLLVAEKFSADPEKAADLEEVLAKLEEMKPIVDREKEDVVYAEGFLREVEMAHAQMAEKVRHAKTNLERARTDMERAKLENQRAEEQMKRSKELAGLSTSFDTVGSALEAMNRKTEKMKAAAEGKKVAANAMSTPVSQNSSAIEQALKEVEGTSGLSAAERLARLKNGG